MCDAVRAIALADASLHAWAYVDERATATAHPGEPLANVAFGVKDIIDVRGMPTRLGISIDVEPARADAWCVAALRAAGAVPVGKTETTAFAWRDPAPTVHPHVAGATPGGSSAGSAAAVGAGHVAFALGTQTIGSTLRPAAYCGVVGYKPTFGVVPVFGAAALAPSVDHIGAIARDVSIARAFATVFGIETRTLGAAPRLAFAADAFADGVGADVRSALDACVDVCRTAGARVDVVELPNPFFETFALLEPLIAVEAFAVHERWRNAALPPALAALLQRGESEPVASRTRALAFRNQTRSTVEAALAPFDAVLLVVADTAPDRASTGDGRPQAPATFYGLPAISIPIGRSEGGLPIGVQILARNGKDAALLAVAAWIERSLARAV